MCLFVLLAVCIYILFLSSYGGFYCFVCVVFVGWFFGSSFFVGCFSR